MKIKKSKDHKNDKASCAMHVEKKDGKLTAIATDETVDRQGEKLDITKWDLKNYLKNPVLQAGHSYMPQNTIGKADNVRIKGKRMLFEPVFHEITEVAREIKKMFDEGFLKTFSVGFMVRYKRDREGRLMREGDGMPMVDKYELLEISAVPIPANQNAEIISRSIENAENEVSQDQMKKIKDWLGIKPDKVEKNYHIVDRVVHYVEHTVKFYKDGTLSEINLDKLNKSVAGLNSLLEGSTDGKGKRLSKGRDLKVLRDNSYEEEKDVKALQHIAKTVNQMLFKKKQNRKD